MGRRSSKRAVSRGVRGKQGLRTKTREKRVKPMHSKSKKLLVLGAVLAVSVSATGTVMANAQSAVVTKDGQRKQLYLLTNGDTQNILNSAGVSTKTGDLVMRSTNAQGKIEVNVRTAYPVQVVADGKTAVMTVHYGDTASDVLKRAGITLGPVDTVNMALNRPLQENDSVRVTRNCILQVKADGKSSEVVANRESTAEEAARAAGVELSADDEMNVPRNQAIGDTDTLTVSRVTYAEQASTQTLDYETKTVGDDTLEAGKTEVETAGKEGQALVIQRTKFVDGKAVSTDEVDRETITEPVTEVIRKGTKKPEPAPEQTKQEDQQTDADGSGQQSSSEAKKDTGKTINGMSYSRVITGECTAYTADSITSTGVPAQVGRVAVDPSEIPYGTRMYVTSADGSYVYGYCVAADTGGFIYNSDTVLDLYMNSEAECQAFGRRDMMIYILD